MRRHWYMTEAAREGRLLTMSEKGGDGRWTRRSSACDEGEMIEVENVATWENLVVRMNASDLMGTTTDDGSRKSADEL